MRVESCRVADLAQQVRGVTYSADQAVSAPAPGYLPILRANNITEDGPTFSDLVYVPASAVGIQQRLRANDVLVATSSGSIAVVGKAVRIAANFEGGFGAFCKVLRPSAEVDPAYFAHFFKTRAYRQRVSSLAAGANINNLRNEHLDDFEIPLPPRPEQRRIAEVLDRAETLRAQRRQALAQLDALAEAIFRSMTGRLGPKAKFATLGDITEEFRYGTSNKSGAVGFPALRIPNVASGRLNLDELKLVAVELAELERLRLRSGDVLFVRTNGNPDNVGRCAAFEPAAVRSSGLSEDSFIFASYLIRVRLKTGSLHPRVLAAYMATEGGRSAVRSRCKTSAGQYNVNIEGLAGIPVPLFAAQEQQRYLAQSVALERVKASHEEALLRLNTLFTSLQHRAFRGEL